MVFFAFLTCTVIFLVILITSSRVAYWILSAWSSSVEMGRERQEEREKGQAYILGPSSCFRRLQRWPFSPSLPSCLPDLLPSSHCYSQAFISLVLQALSHVNCGSAIFFIEKSLRNCLLSSEQTLSSQLRPFIVDCWANWFMIAIITAWIIGYFFTLLSLPNWFRGVLDQLYYRGGRLSPNESWSIAEYSSNASADNWPNCRSGSFTCPLVASLLSRAYSGSAQCRSWI